MELISYAQNFEDVRLWRAFRDITKGRYLDIGTQDPIHDSVSRLFYDRGWRGVHVEPTPHYAAAMRNARPDEQVIEAAVSSSPVPLVFFEIPDTGLSTGVREIAKVHETAGWAFREIVVPTVTLASLFDYMGDDPIQWLKIDVEGMESDVIASWGDHPARPAALVIEATKPLTQEATFEAWHAMVTERGYREVLFDGLSLYFIHESESQRGEALALSPNVFDGFQVRRTHFSAARIAADADEAVAVVRSEAGAQAQVHAEQLAEAIAAAAEASAQLEAALQLAGELKGRLASEAEAHAEALAQAQAAAADAAAQLEPALQRACDLEGQLASEAETHSRALAEAHAAAADASAQLDAALQHVGELEGRLASEEEAHSQSLAEAHAAAADASDKLEVVKVHVAGLERHVQEQARLHATALALAEERTSGAQRALEESNGQLASIQAEHLALGRLAGRLEGQLEAQSLWYAASRAEATTQQDELRDRLRASAKELAALRDITGGLRTQLAVQIAQSEAAAAALAAEKDEMHALLASVRDEARQLTDEVANLTARLALANQQRDEAVARARDLSDEGVGLIDQLEGARQQAAEDKQVLHNHIAQLRDHIAWREQQLQQAAGLLAAIPEPLGGLPRLQAALVRRVAGDARVTAIADLRAAAAHWQSSAMLPAAQEMSQEEILSLASNLTVADGAFMHGGNEMVESDGPITSVPRLLAPHDRQFIHTAYQSVLGRAPDPEGEAYYLARLRAGAHKLAILRQLRQSPEGRTFTPGVAGLDRAIKRHRWATMSLVGAIVRLLTGAEGNSATHRALRILANDLGRMRGEQATLAEFVQQLAARPVVVTEAAAPLPPPPPPAAAVQPPRLDPGPMPDNLDSAERRLLGSLRLFALTRGAPA